MKNLLRMILFIAVFLFFDSTASAKWLRLKSGISLDVIILETYEDALKIKTDYGIIKTFKFNEIESIEGSKVLADPATEQKPSRDIKSQEVQRLYDSMSTEKGFRKEKDQEIAAVINYHFQIEKILQGVERDFNKMIIRSKDIFHLYNDYWWRNPREAGQENNNISSLTAEFKRKLSATIDKIRNLYLPDALVKYYEIILEHLTMMDKAQEEFSRMNTKSSDQYLHSAKVAYFEALKEMKGVLISLKAPNELISDLDIIIQGIQGILD